MNTPSAPLPPPPQPKPQTPPEAVKDEEDMRSWTAEAFAPQRPPAGRRPLFGH